MIEKNRREFLAHGGAALGACFTLSPHWLRSPQARNITLTTDEAFDPTAIAPYAGLHQDIYDYIDEHKDEHIGKVQEYLRQPSISAQSVGMKECAEMTASYLRELGSTDARVVPTPGHPVVWGSIDAEAPKTIMNYGMYDVMPVNPELWSSPPFEARLVDMPPFGKTIIARGAINTKGPLRAFFNACQAIVDVRGRLPVNMMFAIEGEEEMGSIHFPEFVQEYRSEISKARDVIFAQTLQDSKGRVVLWLGFKGIVFMEIEASGARWGRGPTKTDIHSMYKAVVDNPVWRLVRALGTLVDSSNNRIMVPGYEDKIEPPTVEDQELINRLATHWDEATWKEELGVDHFIDDPDRKTLILKYLYDTTLNLAGIWGGYTGPGPKTVLPLKATAKLDTRLVPDQDPEEVVELIRKHLADNGYGDLEVRVLEGYPPCKTSVSAPLIQTTLAVYKKWGIEPAVWPRIAGSAPFYVFTDWLQQSFSYMGIGHGGRHHVPDEYLVVEGNGIVADLIDAEKAWVDTLFALGED